MMRAAIAGLAASLAMFAGTAIAHEFWMRPDSFRPLPLRPVSLTMHVGEQFKGDLVGLSPAFVTQLKRHARSGIADLHSQLPANPSGAVNVPVLPAAVQVFAADTAPSRVDLPAGSFHAYLREEGLDDIIALREKAGTAHMPGRERFRRHVKSVVRGPGAADAGSLQVTGQRLEIVPLTDTVATRAGQDLSFQVLWEGKPRAGALVKLWHHRTAQLVIIRAITDAQGRIVVTPPWPGAWMASVVHMVAATDAADVDWDSYWASITFELNARPS